MSEETPRAFFSYSREDSAFVLQLAKDLRAAGANVWFDQLDIHVGDRWDASIEDALHKCPRVILVVSPGSVASNNVMDEVSFAIDENKQVIPVLYRDCKIPFRLRRLQYLDARTDYQGAVRGLLRLLGVESGHATSQPTLMLDDAMFDKAPVEEPKQKAPSQGRVATAPAPAVAPPRREPERSTPAAPIAAAAKAAPAAGAQTKKLAIGGGAVLALGAAIWLFAGGSFHHDPQPVQQAQTVPAAPASPAASTLDPVAPAPAQTASPASATPPRRVTKEAAAPAESHPPVSQPAPTLPTPVPTSPAAAAAVPPPETKAPPAAAAPSITLPAIYTLKT